MLIEIYISLVKMLRDEKVVDLSENERKKFASNDECEKSSWRANVPEHIG